MYSQSATLNGLVLISSLLPLAPCARALIRDVFEVKLPALLPQEKRLLVLPLSAAPETQPIATQSYKQRFRLESTATSFPRANAVAPNPTPEEEGRR